MFRTNPLATKLATQLAPAAIVTVVGIVLLSNLAKPSDPAPTTAAVEPAINGEAVFKATPREPEVAAEQHDKTVAPRPVVKPKALASTTAQPRKPANEPQQVANLPPPPPLSIVQIPEQPQPVASNDTTVMGKLRSATAAVTRIPQWAGQSLAGWFAAAPTPRPPASVPGQNFQASM